LPRYNVGDRVRFTFCDEEFSGLGEVIEADDQFDEVLVRDDESDDEFWCHVSEIELRFSDNSASNGEAA